MLRLVFSTCPNDTFVFHAWVHGLVPGAPEVSVDHHDVDEANALAEAGAADVVKVSYAALPWLVDRYALLSSGGAVGRGCGPLLLSRPSPLRLGEATVAVPGERTTAYLLFRLWSRRVGHVVVMPFEKIMPAVRDGVVDAGLVIHEARFTYPSYGLECVTDLGAWWEETTGLPIPLGAILARREGDPAAVSGVVRASVEYARANPRASRRYVMSLAQELDPSVAEAHIALYVNDFTVELGEEGRACAQELLGRAEAAGLVPATDRDLLRDC